MLVLLLPLLPQMLLLLLLQQMLLLPLQALNHKPLPPTPLLPLQALPESFSTIELGGDLHLQVRAMIEQETLEHETETETERCEREV